MKETHRINRNGVEYDLTIDEFKDQCAHCGGRGFHTFFTQEDEDRYDVAVDEWSDGDMDDEAPEMQETGKRTCDRCQGTGVHEGDGTAYSYTLKAAHEITMNPNGPDPDRSGVLKYDA